MIASKPGRIQRRRYWEDSWPKLEGANEWCDKVSRVVFEDVQQRRQQREKRKRK